MRHPVVVFAVSCVFAGACGTVTVTPEDAAGDAPQADSADIAVVSDVGSDATPGQDTSGLACQIDTDCLAMKGKTPCNLPVCEAKVCKLSLRKEKEKCINPLDPAGDCEEATCSADGKCNKAPLKDLSKCIGSVVNCGKLCKQGQCVVATTEDYDDKNPCTNDFCDQGQAVLHTPITDLGKLCDDGDSCTTGDACVTGKCQGQVQSCDDNIPCTTDTCDKAKGCVHTGVAAKCNDSNVCTKDACDLAVGCTVAGFELAKACDDGNSCTKNDFCAAGACVSKELTCNCSNDADCVQFNPTISACLGKFKCTIGDPKVPGKCTLDPASAVKCVTTSDTACVKNTCDATSGQCSPQPVKDGLECDDDNKCTSKSTCQKGGCAGTPDQACDDKNPCTTDVCDAEIGCTSTANASPCNDANACTEKDTCGSGVCSGVAKQPPCADEIPCTIDKCDPASGDCSHKLDNTACDDGNPCTLDSCKLGSGCAQAANDTGACTDGNECTKDACLEGKCVSTVTCKCQGDQECNDNNPCTADTCQNGQCVAKATDGGACDTGDKCIQAGTSLCQAGTCKGGTFIQCSGTGDACNAAACNSLSGKCETVSKGDGTACDADNSGCTTSDACQGGKCVPGPKVTCATVDPCMISTCKSTGGSEHTCVTATKPVNTPCEDGKVCSQNDFCDSAGKCQPGAPMPCPGSTCLTGACSETTKGCTMQAKLNGTKCDDGLFCTTQDTCDGTGKCLSGLKLKCEGAPPCGQGTCDEAVDQCVVVYPPQCCVTTSINCDDGISCSKDYCSASTAGTPGQCMHDLQTTCCNPLAYTSAFDKGLLNGLEIVNSTGSTLWGWQLRNQSPIANTPPGALYYGDAKANNFAFSGVASKGTATTPPMNLPAGTVVTFSVFFDTEAGNGYDKFQVSAVTQEGKKYLIWEKTGGTDQLNVWLKIKAPIETVAGTLRIEFLFDTTDNVNNATKGVFLDDITVNVKCGPPAG